MRKFLYLLACFTLFKIYTAHSVVKIQPSHVIQTIGPSFNSALQRPQSLNRQQIQKSFFLSHTLRQFPQLYIQETGGFGQLATTTIRGLKGHHILFLMDGIPVTELGTHTFDFSSLSTTSIAKISLLPGAQSVAYGSGATGGVLSIDMREATPQENFSSALNFGSFGTLQHANTFNYYSDKVKIFTFLSGIQTDGSPKRFIHRSLGEENPFESLNLGTKINISPRKDLEITLSFQHFKNDLTYDSYTNYRENILKESPDALKQSRVSILSSQIEYLPTKTSKHIIITGVSKNFSTFSEPSNKNSYNTTINFAQYKSTFYIHQNHTLNLIGDWRQDNYESPFQKKATLDLLGLGTFYTFNQPNAFSIEMGGRFSQYACKTKTFNYSLGVRLPINNNFHIFSFVKSGYRPPSITSLFGSNFNMANPSLKPEKSQSFEAGYIYEPTFQSIPLQLKMTYFNISINNLIISDGIQGINNRKQIHINSPNKTNSQGVESLLTLHLSKQLQLKASHTYTKRSIPSAKEHLGIPNNKISLATQWLIDKTKNLSLDFNWINKRKSYDFRQQKVVCLKAYAVWNISFNWNIKKSVVLNAKIENIFNQYYSDVAGYPSPPRNFFIGLQIKH